MFDLRGEYMNGRGGGKRSQKRLREVFGNTAESKQREYDLYDAAPERQADRYFDLEIVGDVGVIVLLINAEIGLIVEIGEREIRSFGVDVAARLQVLGLQSRDR